MDNTEKQKFENVANQDLSQYVNLTLLLLVEQEFSESFVRLKISDPLNKTLIPMLKTLYSSKFILISEEEVLNLEKTSAELNIKPD